MMPGEVRDSLASVIALHIANSIRPHMEKADGLKLLEANRDERSIRSWERVRPAASEPKSFGIGLTRLRKLAKEIGRDHELIVDSPPFDVARHLRTDRLKEKLGR